MSVKKPGFQEPVRKHYATPEHKAVKQENAGSLAWLICGTAWLNLKRPETAPTPGV